MLPLVPISHKTPVICCFNRLGLSESVNPSLEQQSVHNSTSATYPRHRQAPCATKNQPRYSARMSSTKCYPKPGSACSSSQPLLQLCPVMRPLPSVNGDPGACCCDIPSNIETSPQEKATSSEGWLVRKNPVPKHLQDWHLCQSAQFRC